ncbi:MAG: putative glycoside hydrolase, partial [Sphingomonadaceae bacterium]
KGALPRGVSSIAPDETSGGVSNALPVYSQVDRSTYPLAVSSGAQRVVLGADLNAVFKLPTVTVDTAQVNTQQDAKRLVWTGPATLVAQAAQPLPLPAYASTAGALQFDVIVSSAPQGTVSIGMQQGGGKGVALEASALFQTLAGKGKQQVTIPLACFAERGLTLEALDVPFSVAADGPFAASFANIQIVGGAATQAGALACGVFK